MNASLNWQGSGLVVLAVLACCPGPLPATTTGDIAAVSSRVSPDYTRRKLPDGSFQAEGFTFGEGGRIAGAFHDASIDNLTFINVARTISGPLAAQHYLPSRDPAQTQLLIMVYWGTTMGSVESPNEIDAKTPEERLMFRDQMDRIDFKNARMLGYDSAGVIGTDYGRGLRATAMRTRVEDLTDEIEDNRYFVVLMAYDFQLLWKQKKHKLVWETRFSIQQRHNDFDHELESMAVYASRYFGQDSHGLVRRPLPEGHVDRGELRFIDVVPEKK